MSERTIVFKYNVDPSGNPISVKIKEIAQVSPLKHMIQLEQLPDELYGVTLLNEDNSMMKQVYKYEEVDKNPNSYYVNYANGLIYFNSTQGTEKKVINYYGTGMELISAKRIFDEYYKADGTLVQQTLQELIDEGREAIELLGQVGGASGVIQILLEKIEEGNIVVGELTNLKQEITQAINVTGNEVVNISEGDWVYNPTSKMYEYTINHAMNSKDLIIDCYNLATGDFVFCGGKIIDNNRVYIQSDEKIDLKVVLNARYYKATLTISDDIAREVVEARKTHKTVGKRLDNFDSQLDKKATKGYLYDTALDSVIDTYNLLPSDYYLMYDGLISKYPTMFGKHELGKDQSNQYPIYLYQYKPKNYKNTIFVTCGVHGYENYTTYIMYLFLKNLLDSSQTPLQLSNLKNNTRILLMPVCNPWGMFQTPKTRWNSRGVDLNRNFDWNWENNPIAEPFTDNYKGTAPFSENESKYIKYVFDNYNIDSAVDLHNYPERWTNNPYKYVIYGDTKTWDIMEDLIVYLKRNNNSMAINHSSSQNDSCVNNYASSVKLIPALNTEFMKGQHGAYESKEDASAWLSLLQNILILLSATYNNDLPLNKLTVKNGQLTKELTNESWTELTELGIEYNANYEGILSVDGWLTVSNTLDTDVLTIDPIIEQEGNYTIKPDVNRFRPNFYGKKMYVPFNVKLPIIKSDNKATFKLKVINEGTGVCTVNRYFVNYTFLETKNSYNFIYTHNKV